MPQSYGGYVWSGNEPTPYHDDASAVTALGLFGAGSVGAFAAATHTMASGRRPIDYIAAAARYGGNQSPFQLLNTFRVPEFLSPFTSDAYRRMGRDTLALGHGFGFGPDGSYTWKQEFLKEDSTYDWLKHVTGLDESGLRDAGITRNMVGVDGTLADELVWRRNSRFGGSLHARVGGVEHKIADRISLMAANQELNSAFSGKHGLNRAAASVFAAADIYAKTGADPDNWDNTIFARGARAGDPSKTASYIPVSAPGASWRGTELLRSVPAFSMDRFNRLLGDLGNQLIGETGSDTLRALSGVGANIMPGPASAQFMRFGGKAALAGAGIMAIGELDWARRNFGLPGQVLASAAVSAGVAQATYKLTRTNPRTAFAAGVASFFGQMIMPGFDQGLTQGFATTYANMTMVRAAPINPFNYWRRTLEGMAPGVTDWTTGLAFGIGVGAAAGLGSTNFGRLPTLLATRFNMGVDASDVELSVESVRDRYRRFVQNTMPAGLDNLEHLNALNVKWYEAERARTAFLEKGTPVTHQLMQELERVSATSGTDLVSRIGMNVKGHALNAYYSFFGADVSKMIGATDKIGDMGFKSLGPIGIGKLGRIMTTATFAFAAHQFFGGGLLGSMEDTRTLGDLYAGRQMIEVKKGRFWEGGGTPYEGEKTDFFRPHWYKLLTSNAQEAAVWGGTGDEYSPMTKFFLKNFTYHLERENYYTHPYPVSGAAFADVPVIGGLLSSTVGRLVKPAKIMHAQEWIREGANGLEFASVFQGSRQEPSYALGAAGPGIPQNPLAAREQLAFLSYQFRELEGLTGYAKNVLQKTITGAEQFNTDSPLLATANDMTSWRNSFWERDLGGMLGSNEFLRRFLPKTPYEKKRFNPISNSMPSWLPDKLHYGNPYADLKTGWARLPGPGYAALHPELQGVDPEDYPLLAQYSILGDVAPYSEEYRSKKTMIYRRRAVGEFTPEQERYIDYLDSLHAKKMNQLSFEPMHPNAVDLPGFGLARGAYGAGMQALRTVAAPAEYMVPMGFRPVQKFLNDRSPVEEYEYQRLYGTPMSFWDEPVRDWFRPAMYSAMHMMGFDGKPLWRHEADNSQKYFDTLDYLKYMRAADRLRAEGNYADAYGAEWMAGQTRHGVNPMGTPLSIYWSLPAEERKFFNAFSHAQGADRKRILEMVPGDQAHLYQAMWSRMDSGDPSLWGGAPSQIDKAYLQSRRDAAEAYLANQPMPDEDWIGWNEDVDMDDIRVRYVSELGKDIHDFGLWDSQLRQSNRQPFLEGSTSFLHDQGGIGYITDMSHQILGQGSTVTATPWGGSQSSVQITYNDDREPELLSRVLRSINGY